MIINEDRVSHDSDFLWLINGLNPPLPSPPPLPPHSLSLAELGNDAPQHEERLVDEAPLLESLARRPGLRGVFRAGQVHQVEMGHSDGPLLPLLLTAFPWLNDLQGGMWCVVRRRHEVLQGVVWWCTVWCDAVTWGAVRCGGRYVKFLKESRWHSTYEKSISNLRKTASSNTIKFYNCQVMNTCKMW